MNLSFLQKPLNDIQYKLNNTPKDELIAIFSIIVGAIFIFGAILF